MGFKPYARYYRPLAQSGKIQPAGALPLAGGPTWFTHAQVISRTEPSRIVPADAIPSRMLTCLTAARSPLGGLMMDRPRIMGILNLTPDSFSDGGSHVTAGAALAHGRQMVRDGASIVDVGGESTRPGALEVPEEAEIARVEPVITALSEAIDAPISVDTRKASVAEAAIGAGAAIVNDISGFTFDPDLAPFCADHHVPVCIMHSPGTPDAMQNMTDYDHLLLDIYDHLGRQIAKLEAAGIPRARMCVDPGIGFGKTGAQNLDILANLSLFHGHGVPLLVGASRKGFIGRVGREQTPAKRMPGSVAVALGAVAQGAHILRVHDVPETAQALALWQAVHLGEGSDDA